MIGTYLTLLRRQYFRSKHDMRLFRYRAANYPARGLLNVGGRLLNPAGYNFPLKESYFLIPMVRAYYW